MRWSLSSRCSACRDQARFIAAVCIDHDQHFAGASDADSDEARFAHSPDVLDRETHRIEQHALCIGE